MIFFSTYKKKNLGIIKIILFVLAFFSSLFFFQTIFADTGHNISGWGWSENIGWISFDHVTGGSGFAYGVNIDESTGAFSGYAWSDNVGWISFNPADSGGSPATLNWSNGIASGQGKVLSTGEYFQLGGANPVTLNLSNNQFSGYAWGQIVVGWVDFSGVSINRATPTVDISASPNPVNYNTASTLSWTTSGSITGCTAQGDWSGGKSTLGGAESTGNLTSNKTYTLSCTGPGGTAQDSVTVTVNTPAQCQDGIDNDGDTWVDYPEEPGCSSASDNNETNAPINPVTQCSDGVNNDGANGADGNDPTCSDPLDILEGPTPDFSLSRSNDVQVIFVADQAQTTSTSTIRVNATNFSNNVTLSVTNVSPNIPGNESFNFSDTTLSAGEYTQGSQFSITIPGTIATRTYTITVRGTDGAISRTVDVLLNVVNLDPTFEEF